MLNTRSSDTPRRPVSGRPPKIRASGSSAPIRRESDREANAVAGFCNAHPEYRRLGADVVEQVMATFRTDEEHEELRRVWGDGLPVGGGQRWSDDA